jgi:hypothetical protein
MRSGTLVDRSVPFDRPETELGSRRSEFGFASLWSSLTLCSGVDVGGGHESNPSRQFKAGQN